MSRTYVVLTLLLAVLIVGYLALTSDSTSIRSQEIQASETDPADEPATAADNAKDQGHNWWMIVSTTVLVIVAVIGTLVLARLQHRRREAYRKVAQQQKDAARAAAVRSSSDMDDA